MSDLMQGRLDRAERALTRAGFTYTEGAQEWKPPIGPSASPLLDRIDYLLSLLADCTDINRALGFIIERSDNEGKEQALAILSEHLEKCDATLSGRVLLQSVMEPDNLRSHRDSWQKALAHLVELEQDRDQREYWEHELRAMSAMYLDLDRRLNAGRDTEWTDGDASKPTLGDYRELQAQHDQLQSLVKATMDTLSSAVKTAEFEGHAHRPWHDSAKTLLAGQAPMPEPAPVVPDELDYDVELESGEYDHELDEPFLRGRVQGWNDCRSAMLAAHKPEAKP